MFEALGFFAVGLVLLALGGDSIVKGASGVAQRFGASPFVAGLLLVAFGTSLPELAVNARAVWTGAQQLALGNAVGSNVVNIGLTLGIAALVSPLLVRSRAIVPLLAWLIGTTLVVIAMGFDGVLVRSEGAILLIGFAGMLFFLLKRARNEPAELQETIAAYATTRADLAMNLLRVAIAIALLYFGAKFVVQSAPVVGVAMGLSPLLTGLLPVAIGTALPEIAAAVAAARRGQGDIGAVGGAARVLGSGGGGGDAADGVRGEPGDISVKHSRSRWKTGYVAISPRSEFPTGRQPLDSVAQLAQREDTDSQVIGLLGAQPSGELRIVLRSRGVGEDACRGGKAQGGSDGEGALRDRRRARRHASARHPESRRRAATPGENRPAIALGQ